MIALAYLLCSGIDTARAQESPSVSIESDGDRSPSILSNVNGRNDSDDIINSASCHQGALEKATILTECNDISQNTLTESNHRESAINPDYDLERTVTLIFFRKIDMGVLNHKQKSLQSKNLNFSQQKAFLAHFLRSSSHGINFSYQPKLSYKATESMMISNKLMLIILKNFIERYLFSIELFNS